MRSSTWEIQLKTSIIVDGNFLCVEPTYLCKPHKDMRLRLEGKAPTHYFGYNINWKRWSEWATDVIERTILLKDEQLQYVLIYRLRGITNVTLVQYLIKTEMSTYFIFPLYLQHLTRRNSKIQLPPSGRNQYRAFHAPEKNSVLAKESSIRRIIGNHFSHWRTMQRHPHGCRRG